MRGSCWRGCRSVGYSAPRLEEGSCRCILQGDTSYKSFIEACVPTRYSIHLWDLKHTGTWENKGTYVYYTDFVMELTMLFLDLMHHIHMLVRTGVPQLPQPGQVWNTFFIYEPILACCTCIQLPKQRQCLLFIFYFTKLKCDHFGVICSCLSNIMLH